LVSGLLGAAVSGLYSEPANRFLRGGFGDKGGKLTPAAEPAQTLDET